RQRPFRIDSVVSSPGSPPAAIQTGIHERNFRNGAGPPSGDSLLAQRSTRPPLPGKNDGAARRGVVPDTLQPDGRLVRRHPPRHAAPAPVIVLRDAAQY